MHVVGASERECAAQSGRDAEVLAHDDGDGQADEREPRDRRKDVEEQEQRGGQEDERADGERARRGHAGRADAGCERRRCDVRGREERTGRPEDRDLDGEIAPEIRLRHEREREAERERRPEAAAVEAERLRDELADRALGGRQGIGPGAHRRERYVPSSADV